MCGIAGWFSPTPHLEDARQRLQGMLHAIRHRGPDGQGMAILEHAALGHVRLAIIDPAAGAQPMEAGGVTISFNGEIYNYRELRADLARRGYRFRTHSDTEVILGLYQRDGWPALARLRGMYALALWDAPRRQGLLVRDPSGIKPLFLAQHAGGLLFGSEAKAILAHGAIPADLDPGALHLVMNFRYLPGEHCLFREIRQLAPGRVLEWRPDGVRERDLPGHGFSMPNGTLEQLRDSVRAHLTADVEVGTYLSGGIDSAAITALACREGLRRSFTLNVGDDPQEARNAAATARLLGVENLQASPALDVAGELPGLVRTLEVPKINSLQVSLLAKLAARHVKVTLSGLGGDELFYGYNAHGIMQRAARLARFSPGPVHQTLGATAAALLRGASRLPWGEAERAARMLASLGDWPRVYALLRNVWDAPELRPRIYGPRLLDAELPNAFGIVEQGWPEDPDPVRAMARFEWREKMVNDLLWQEDRASMAHGLEVRVPLVDLALAQAVARRDREELMPRGRLKGHLKASLTGLLPGSIMDRPKSGFQVDAPAFFNSHLREMAREWLSEARIRDYGLFNPEFVRQVLAAPPRRGYRWHFFMLYLMLMTHLWMGEFVAPSTP